MYNRLAPCSRLRGFLQYLYYSAAEKHKQTLISVSSGN